MTAHLDHLLIISITVPVYQLVVSNNISSNLVSKTLTTMVKETWHQMNLIQTLHRMMKIHTTITKTTISNMITSTTSINSMVVLDHITTTTNHSEDLHFTTQVEAEGVGGVVDHLDSIIKREIGADIVVGVVAGTDVVP